MSSNHALQAARRVYNAAKAGHTGTLDPLASGLLPLCFGEATKFAGELLNADKTYLATVQLGVTTDTADAAGKVLERHPITVSKAQLTKLLEQFRGEIEQIPPMVSAIKRCGRPLYEYARAGIELPRAPRRITIHELSLTAWSTERFELTVRCSKGAYIRTLAADLGSALGCGAHLAALRRIQVGMLSIDQALSLDTLQTHTAPPLLPPDYLLAELPQLALDVETARLLGQGQRLNHTAAPGRYRCLHGGKFIGLGEIDNQQRLKPLRWVNQAAQ